MATRNSTREMNVLLVSESSVAVDSPTQKVADILGPERLESFKGS